MAPPPLMVVVLAFVLIPEVMDSEFSDRELAHQIASAEPGAEAAEAALYRRFAPRIELYGLRHLGSRTAAQDLVQQVMVRVLEALRAGRLENPGSLASFVLGTCRHVTWDTRRADWKQRKLEREIPHEASIAPPALVEVDVVRLLGCIQALPGREATVVRMSFWEDRAAEEIGARLGLSAGNVRVIRHRALAQLAGCMQAEVPA